MELGGTKKLVLLLLPAVCLLGFFDQGKFRRDILPEEKKELVDYLRSNWAAPEDYIIGKFRDYDLVFVGEAHHIKHDVELIHNLIPLLHQNGVYNLGIEFGCYEYQDKVDSLITAESYDEDLARWLLFKWGSFWPYKEYMDLYKKAWELNRSLPDDLPKFRIVNLDYRARWDLVTENMPARRLRKVFHKGERDVHMARVILEEIVGKNQKALIYAGQQHAATHFYHPVYDFKKQKFLHFNKDVMGHLVYRRMPDRVFNICLHYPWQSFKSHTDFNYPVGGAIDTIMEEFADKRVGFDVTGTPIGDLRDDLTLYSAGRKNFKLGDFCDGYVFQKHIGDYEGCEVDFSFVTEENFKEAVDYLSNPRLKKIFKSPQQFLVYMRLKANPERRFGGLK
jgi:hypothetical protein